MIKAVLFDMDGVLLDSYDMWFFMFKDALKRFENRDMAKKEFDDNVWARSMKVLAKEYFPGKEKQVLAYYWTRAQQFLDKMEVFPVEDLLKQLKDNGLKLAVVSNTFNIPVKYMLKWAGFAKYFDLIVGADSIANPKPAPDCILYCLHKFKLKPSDSVFVGDTKYDIQAGKAAGVFTIGLGVDGGDTRIEDLHELADLDILSSE
ncbi:MAG: HAD family hydrolase [Nanoarchaeota archaeon]|nr:HAD family hydrolase [Nanoarchaeota archaeon]